jgi:putrescine:ornithine antiporter
MLRDTVKSWSTMRFQWFGHPGRPGSGAGLAALGCIVGLALVTAPAAPAAADALDKIRQAGKITLGYRTDASPFSLNDSSGKADGYSVALCGKIVDQVKSDLQLSALAVDWVPVTAADQVQAVKDGKIDLLCGGTVETLGLRRDVAFSIPIFPGGIGALLRADAAAGLKEALSGRQATGPLWRGNPAQILTNKTFSAVTGSLTQSWLASRLDYFQLTAKMLPVAGYDAGTSSVLDRASDVFFAERSILLDAVKRSPAGSDLVVLDRKFTSYSIALVLGRGSDDFRLVVDKALSHFYGTEGFRSLYTIWFGEMNDSSALFFKEHTLED